MTVRNKIILVTGGAGFIGSHLCKRLQEQGHRVISLDNYFAGSKENHVPGVEYREGHTKDIVRHVPETPDLIFHLGEYARVEQSLLEPEVVHDLNTVGTAAVVEFWKEKKCKLVYAGSSTKFGDEGTFRDKTPYSATKAENTELVKKTGDALGLPYAITYFYNVYGPGERAGMYGTLIEIFKQVYLHGEPLAVTAPGTQTRNFTHIDDIIDGLLLVGEKGTGDEFGLGNERAYTILEVAQLFGGDVVMLPPRAGNRTHSRLDPSKSKALGWSVRRELTDYIAEFVRSHKRGAVREKRVLVCSTTFYPVEGPAERALVALMREMPDVQFDVVTTRFSRDADKAELPVSNATIYRVGSGSSFDKYLLPVRGFKLARELYKKHRYLFAWSIMASYAALLGVRLKRASNLPLLITLADQNLANVSPAAQFFLRRVLTDADQVYGISTAQEARAASLSSTGLRTSIGDGDAFANQLRYAYAEILRTRMTQ